MPNAIINRTDQRIVKFVREQGPCALPTLYSHLGEDSDYIKGRVGTLVLHGPLRFDEIMRLEFVGGK